MDLKPFTGNFLGLSVKVTGISFIISGLACRLMPVCVKHPSKAVHLLGCGWPFMTVRVNRITDFLHHQGCGRITHVI